MMTEFSVLGEPGVKNYLKQLIQIWSEERSKNTTEALIYVTLKMKHSSHLTIALSSFLITFVEFQFWEFFFFFFLPYFLDLASTPRPGFTTSPAPPRPPAPRPAGEHIDLCDVTYHASSS